MSKIRATQQHPNVEIAVRNFGPISEATIDLRPLTVFVGPSNTGKTYFSTLVNALHSAFDSFSGFAIHVLQYLHGEIAFNPEDASSRKILAVLNASGGRCKFSDLPQEISDEIQAILEDSDFLLEVLGSYLDVDSPKDMRKSTGSHRDEMVISLEVSEKNQKIWCYKMVVSESDITAAGSVDENMPFFVGMPFFVEDEQEWDETLGFSGFLKLIDRLINGGGKLYYLPATRSGLMQSHAVIASSLVARSTRSGFERFPEVPMFPNGISDFLQQLIRYKERKAPNSEMMAIADALESNVLYGKIIWQPSPSGYPEFRYRPQEMAEEIRLTQASSMVSELAPLVLFLRGIISPGDTLIIEEPEAHLHPGAQTEMAATLARLVRAGVRVVVTTHSDWLLKEIGNLIREGILNEKGELRRKTHGPERWLLPEEVGAWQFYKEKPVEALRFTNLDGIEPPDYEELALNLYNRSAGLHNRLEETEGNNSSE